jgi:hypothetical protein
VIAKNSNTAIYEPGTYNARGQMMHFAMNNKSLYTTFGYDDFGLPPTFKTMLSTAYVIPRFFTRNLRG